MLDVSMHIRDKGALFREITRVLRPGGMLVMHEQTAPIPKAMQPITRRALRTDEGDAPGASGTAAPRPGRPARGGTGHHRWVHRDAGEPRWAHWNPRVEA